MPRTGIPAPSRPAGAGGASSAYTEAGPPDRMTAFGLRARICAAGMLAGTISECTWHSLTRRAISCAYWAPKSTTRTVSNSGTGCTMPPPWARRSSPLAAGLAAAPGHPSLRASSTLPARLAGRLSSLRLRGWPRWRVGRGRRGAPGLAGCWGCRAGLPVGGDRADPYPGDAPGVHLGHRQPVAVHLDRVTHRREPAEGRQHVPG